MLLGEAASRQQLRGCYTEPHPLHHTADAHQHGARRGRGLCIGGQALYVSKGMGLVGHCLHVYQVVQMVEWVPGPEAGTKCGENCQAHRGKEGQTHLKVIIFFLVQRPQESCHQAKVLGSKLTLHISYITHSRDEGAELICCHELRLGSLRLLSAHMHEALHGRQPPAQLGTEKSTNQKPLLVLSGLGQARYMQWFQMYVI